MKNSLLLFFLVTLSFATYAERTSYTQSAPISISADGMAGEMGEDEATMKAREELSRSRIKKVKTDEEVEKEVEVEVVEIEEEKEVVKKIDEETRDQPQAKNEVSTSLNWSFKNQPTFFQLKLAHVNSSWSELSQRLEDGSWQTGFSIGRFFSSNLSASLGLEFFHAKDADWVAEKTRLSQLRVEVEHHRRLNSHFSFVSGLGLLLADWNVRQRISTKNQQDLYQRYDDGAGVGSAVSTGLRFHLSEAWRVDTQMSWTQYFGRPQKDFGGLEFGLRLNIEL